MEMVFGNGDTCMPAAWGMGWGKIGHELEKIEN
jgi:hypothetical protein